MEYYIILLYIAVVLLPCIHILSVGKNYWAKDIIFLVTTGDEIGAQAWINSYMGDRSTGKGLAIPVQKERLCKKYAKHHKRKSDVVGRIRTCAGRAQWISSPSP